jgi:hypothetical protein
MAYNLVVLLFALLLAVTGFAEGKSACAEVDWRP